jgi:hypothetical protein
MVLIRAHEPELQLSLVVDGDVRQPVVEEGVAEALEHGRHERLPVDDAIAERGHDLLEQHRLQPPADRRVLKRFPNERHARSTRASHERRVGPIEDADLAQRIGPDISRQGHGGVLQQRYPAWCLHDPRCERLHSHAEWVLGAG